MDKKQSRMRRAVATRRKIAELRVHRLPVDQGREAGRPQPPGRPPAARVLEGAARRDLAGARDRVDARGHALLGAPARQGFRHQAVRHMLEALQEQFFSLSS